MSKKKKIVLMILCALIVIGAVSMGVVYKLYKDQNATIMEIKDKIKIFLCDIKIDKLSDETSGVTFYDTLYEDEGKKTVETDKGIRLVHYASGYYMDFPENTEFDFSCSPSYVKIKTENYDLTVSREYSTDDDVAAYIEHYLDRFMLNGEYREANGITLLQEKTDQGTYDYYSVRLDGYEEGYDGYTYVNIYTGTKIYYRLTFKFSGEDFQSVQEEIDSAVKSFRYFRPEGKDSYTVEYKNLSNETLTGEAKALYEDIENSESVRWGIFTEDVYGDGIEKTIPGYEEKLDYEFSVVLSYVHFGTEFPTEFAETCYENGKVMELTYQVTDSNNEDLYGYTPQLDIYRGEKDEEIREFARAAAQFGKPFLFRLGNEMNSDWTSYSGVVNMIDPEVYVAVWQRIYNIFQEEGATNAIWIYNPNDRAYPPCNWNDFHAYYPGDEYVNLIGITGYNNGTYYKEQNNEVWREFKDIYDTIEKEYSPFFGDFPWIITEFSSSSIGGDKAKWMERMFEDIDDYENIKIAVWFDYADYDPAYEGNSVVSRPYWLLETEETTEAAKEGFALHEREKWYFE